MSTARCLLISSITLLGLWAVSLAQAPNQPPTKEAPAFVGQAIFVMIKHPTQDHQFLERPQIRTFGERSFLIGHAVHTKTRVWIPLADVARIEEFADMEELTKHYRIGNPPKK